LAGHILTVQSYQFCAVQEAKCAVQNDNVRLILSKIHKIVCNRVSNFKAPKAPNSISVWAVPKNPLGECSPEAVAVYKGPTSEEREGTEWKGGE